MTEQKEQTKKSRKKALAWFWVRALCFSLLALLTLGYAAYALIPKHDYGICSMLNYYRQPGEGVDVLTVGAFPIQAAACAVMSARCRVTRRRGRKGRAKSHRNALLSSVGTKSGEAVRPARLQMLPQSPVVRTAMTRVPGGRVRQAVQARRRLPMASWPSAVGMCPAG